MHTPCGAAQGGRAFALPYVILLIVVLALFFSAVYLRTIQTLRFARYDLGHVQAQQLAKMGCDLGYWLYQNDGPDWMSQRGGLNPIGNDQFGAQFASDKIGGTFQLQIYDRSELSLDPFPAGGTYKVLVCRAKVGDREATARMSLKITNPFVNYLAVTTLFQPSGKIDGPIFVNAAPPTQSGDCQFLHEYQIPWAGTQNTFVQLNPTFSGTVEAVGDIFLRNSSFVGGAFTQPPKYLNGFVAAGTVLQNNDLTPINNPFPQGGALTIGRDSSFTPHVEHAVTVPKMQDLLEVYRTHESDANVKTIPIDSGNYPEGVLVEFFGGNVYVSAAQTKQVGRLYDRGVYLDSRMARVAGSSEGAVPAGSDSAAWAANNWVTSHSDYVSQMQVVPYPGNADAVTRSEMDWVDPFYPHAVAPSVLTGKFQEIASGNTFSLAPGNADYCDVKRLVRASSPRTQQALQTGTGWTVIRLLAQDCNTVSADYPTPRHIAPPVYVRGVVKGRVVLVYDVADDAIDPPGAGNEDQRLPMFVLGEHEDPSDTADKLTPGPLGVPGGLHLADPNVQLTPGAGTFSNDFALLLSRGSLSSAGPNSYGYSWLVDGNSRVDYRQHLRDLDLSYERALGADYRLMLQGDVSNSQASFQAVGIGDVCDYHRATSDYRVVTTYTEDTLGRRILPGQNTMGTWADAIGSPLPPLVNPAVMPTLPRFLRLFYSGRCPSLNVVGGYSATDFRVGSSMLTGQFDYRWRAKTEAELREDIKLPVGPIILQSP